MTWVNTVHILLSHSPLSITPLLLIALRYLFVVKRKILPKLIFLLKAFLRMKEVQLGQLYYYKVLKEQPQPSIHQIQALIQFHAVLKASFH